MLELFCASSNRHKLSEFQLASGSQIAIRSCDPVDCPETGDSFEANALQKALCYNSVSRAEWLFADDSGLEVDALDGAPGIYSARFAGPAARDQANNKLLLSKLKGLPRAERSANFVCAIALLHNGSHAKTFRGTVDGLILRRHSGRHGFGYDPLFYYPPVKKSFGCLPAPLKWEHSHRGRAFRAMIEWVGKHT